MPINSLLYPAPSVPPAYSVSNSLMFNDADTAYLSINPGSSGNPDKWTFSCWVKRTVLSASQIIFSAGSDTNNRFEISFESDDKIRIFQKVSGSVHLNLQTTQVFRDVASWYHVCLAVDTGQGTDANKFKLYINGTQVTSFSTSTYFADDTNTLVSDASYDMFIGAGNGYASNYFFDGYLAECLLINDEQLAPTSFGEFDPDSPRIWRPVNVLGKGLTFGTNGFYLEFKQTGTSANSSGLGADTSGNDNHFSVTNLAATDQMIDTCSNNFCIMNSLTGSASGYAMAYAQGNLNLDGDQSWSNSMGTFGVTAGKWFWEIENFSYEHTQVGIASPYIDWGSAGVQDLTGTTLYYNSAGGEVRKDGSATTADYGTFGTNDVLGIALNMDDGQITFYKNGSAIVSNYAISTSITTAVPLIAISGDYTIDINFGSPAIAITSGNADANGYGSFEYSVPSGYFSLCTKNLAEYGG